MGRYNILIADELLPRINEVAEELRRAGMEVEQVHATIGVVSGSADEHTLAAIRSVPGVEHVEAERTFTIAERARKPA